MASMPARSDRDAPEVLLSYQPESAFTRTVGWVLIAIPLLLAALSFLDFARNPSAGLLVLNLLIGFGGAAVMYGLSKAVDRAQESCRLEVLDDATLRWRNILGRVRVLPLDDATDFEVKDFRRKPSMIHRGRGDPSPSSFSTAPHVTQIRVRYGARRRTITMTGSLSPDDREKLDLAVHSFTQTT